MPNQNPKNKRPGRQLAIPPGSAGAGSAPAPTASTPATAGSIPPQATKSKTAHPQASHHKARHSRRIKMLLWAVLFTCVLSAVVLVGSLAGFQSARNVRNAVETNNAQLAIKEQYDLGTQDMLAGRFEVARQRFEYILAQDPNYPGVTDQLTEVMAVLYSTATPTPAPATITPTTTPDTRPIQELFNQVVSLLGAKKWNDVMNTVASLRQANPTYQAPRVDGMLYIALRQRGIDEIWKEGNLEPGIYNLALAERFGPLDAQAISSRQLARLYLIGSSFWEVNPQEAVNYFSQVAAAAPGLHDASGYTAAGRYKESLVQLGDSLYSNKDWCNSQKQYELALSMGADAALEGKVRDAALKCSPPSATPGQDTATPTSTSPGPTVPPAATGSPTATQAAPPQASNTPIPTQVVPPTAEPPTAEPTTAEPPTAEPPTAEPPTAAPTAETPPTQQPMGQITPNPTSGALAPVWQALLSWWPDSAFPMA